ncbi:hypothetical protein [Ruegeria sp. HKCCD8929]|uniref:DUF6915 family protein n=1 Tax=Ruegeria sp. HKCCD8929 TaxID=2683006 RepID=UPI001489168E|nr:hypothetical protein [Ruegeria sp. HKCCD8929]
MAHSYHHAESSARKFGGVPEDYCAVHTWFDQTKAWLPTPAHRAIRHHAQGVFLAEQVFGVTITNSAGRKVPTRFIGEQHVREDCRCIPTAADWLKALPIESWMVNGILLPDIEIDPDAAGVGAWRQAVAGRQTLLGLKDWQDSHRIRQCP